VNGAGAPCATETNSCSPCGAYECALVRNVLVCRQADSTMCYRCVQLTQRTSNLLAAAISGDEHRCWSGVGDAYAACPNAAAATAANEILLWSEYRNRLCV
jgi:hypothetical protein